jgi:hypothetical protein
MRIVPLMILEIGGFKSEVPHGSILKESDTVVLGRDKGT